MTQDIGLILFIFALIIELIGAVLLVISLAIFVEDTSEDDPRRAVVLVSPVILYLLLTLLGGLLPLSEQTLSLSRTIVLVAIAVCWVGVGILNRRQSRNAAIGALSSLIILGIGGLAIHFLMEPHVSALAS